MPKNGQVVAVHRRNVAVLIVPPQNARAVAATRRRPRRTNGTQERRQSSKAAAKQGAHRGRAKPIEKIEDLYGKTIAMVGRSPANIALLNTILAQYGVPADKMTTLQFTYRGSDHPVEDAAKFDALLAIGPIGSKITAEAITAAARGKEPPVFLEVGSSEAIEQQNPVYRSDRNSGRRVRRLATGGSSRDHRRVALHRRAPLARRQVAGNFTSGCSTPSRRWAASFPAFTKIESPDTDKAATLAVHPGALAYLEGEQKTFFERYSEVDVLGFDAAVVLRLGRRLAR